MKPDTFAESLLNRGGDVLAAGVKKQKEYVFS